MKQKNSIGKKAQLSTVARIMLIVVLLIVLFFALKGLMDKLFG